MKKKICIITLALMLVSLFGCGASTSSQNITVNQGKSVNDVINEKISDEQTTGTTSVDKTKKKTVVTQSADSANVDVDLTKLSSTVVYSEVYDMMSSPEKYMGKRIKINGDFNYYEGDNRYYYACIISDATACCAQGMEFVLKGGKKFPDEYPDKGTNITVVGMFDTYYEGENRYCQLIDAVIE